MHTGALSVRQKGEGPARARERLLDLVLAEGSVDLVESDFSFETVDDCLAAAFEEFTHRLKGAIRAGCELCLLFPRAKADRQPASWVVRVQSGLEALLAELVAEPDLTRALIRSYPALGAEQKRRYKHFLNSVVPLLAEGPRSAEKKSRSGNPEVLAVAAGEAIIVDEIEASRTTRLPELAPSILLSVLTPFLGASAAAAEVERAYFGSE